MPLSRFEQLKTRLRERGEGSPTPRPVEVSPTGASRRRQAAVSVILRAHTDVDVLLIKRAEMDGDPWSGHMALPGGRREPADEHLLATAVRETWEETGIHLHDAPLLGRLTELRPSSRHIPPIIIQPFVFAVDAATEAAVASAELEAVHWVTLRELRDPAVQGSLDVRLGDRDLNAFPTFEVRGETVWGLTYRILTELLEIYEPGR